MCLCICVFVYCKTLLCFKETKQILLYFLFDLVQNPEVCIAVIGLTSEADVVNQLEKRVKSRFSARKVRRKEGVRGGGDRAGGAGGRENATCSARQPSPVHIIFELSLSLSATSSLSLSNHTHTHTHTHQVHFFHPPNDQLKDILCHCLKLPPDVPYPPKRKAVVEELNRCTEALVRHPLFLDFLDEHNKLGKSVGWFIKVRNLTQIWKQRHV